MPFEEPGLIPLASLSEAERRRLRTEREKILDMLEEEEQGEQKRPQELTQEQRAELLQKRKEAAKVEVEKLKKAKALQKKMGKALLRGLADDREKGEKAQTHASGENVKKKEGKSVSFADPPSHRDGQKPDSTQTPPQRVRTKVGSIPLVRAAGGQLPMKMHIIERFSGTSVDAQSAPPIQGTVAHQLASPSVNPTPTGLDYTDQKEYEPSQNPETELDIDADRAQTKVEIATEYYKKRGTIGEQASKALASHPHHDEWNQPVGTRHPITFNSHVTSHLSRKCPWMLRSPHRLQSRRCRALRPISSLVPTITSLWLQRRSSRLSFRLPAHKMFSVQFAWVSLSPTSWSARTTAAVKMKAT